MIETLGEKIKHYRRIKGYSQEQLAEKTELSKMSIRRYETGERQPRIETIKKIADSLNITLNDLLPDSIERDIQTGRTLSATDYSFIESMVTHKTFSDNERKTIFQKIEKYRTTLLKIQDMNKLEEYSEKTHEELETLLLKMLLNKPDCAISDVIIILSCFLSLKERGRTSLIDILLNHCYPNVSLKYWGILSDDPLSE